MICIVCMKSIPAQYELCLIMKIKEGLEKYSSIIGLGDLPVRDVSKAFGIDEADAEGFEKLLLIMLLMGKILLLKVSPVFRSLMGVNDNTLDSPQECLEVFLRGHKDMVTEILDLLRRKNDINETDYQSILQVL